MMDAIWLAIAAAFIVAMASVVLKRLRQWLQRTVVRATRALSPRRHEDLERAVERIAQELAARRCQQDGNPDDELYSDWLRWFRGDPTANVDYSRKQQRDMDRLARGEFRRR